MFDQEEINRWNAMMMWGGERAQEVEAGQVMLQVRRRASANCVLLCVVHVLHALCCCGVVCGEQGACAGVHELGEPGAYICIPSTYCERLHCRFVLSDGSRACFC